MTDTPDCPSNHTIQTLVDASTYYCIMPIVLLQKQINSELEYVNKNKFKNFSEISKLVGVSLYARSRLQYIAEKNLKSDIEMFFELHGKNELLSNISPQDWTKVTVKLMLICRNFGFDC